MTPKVRASPVSLLPPMKSHEIEQRREMGGGEGAEILIPVGANRIAYVGERGFWALSKAAHLGSL